MITIAANIAVKLPLNELVVNTFDIRLIEIFCDKPRSIARQLNGLVCKPNPTYNGLLLFSTSFLGLDGETHGPTF